ncbi:MAG: DUF1573 domain-containing protein [Kiritimatiellia bacterium]
MKFHLLCALLALAASTRAFAAPKIECDQPKFDFGTSLNDRVIEHSFTLRNAGDEELVIQSVNPSCGCTLAEIGDKNLAPGESTVVKARLDLSNRLGRQDKNIAVFSNDPANRTLTLLISGDSISALKIDPPVLAFGTISPTGTVTKTVFITSSLGEKFKVLDVVSPQKIFQSKVTPVEEGIKYQIDVTVTGTGRTGGAVNDNLVIYTDHPKARVMALAAYGQIPEPIAVSPGMITLLTNTGGRPVTRYVTLRPGLVTQFKVLKAEFPDPSVVVSIREHTQYGYQIMLQGIMPKADLAGKEVVITTDARGREQIRIPIQIMENGRILGTEPPAGPK